MFRLCALSILCAALVGLTTRSAFADDDPEPTRRIRIVVKEKEAHADGSGRIVGNEDDVVVYELPEGEGGSDDPTALIIKWLSERAGEDPLANSLRKQLEKAGWNTDRLGEWLERGMTRGRDPMERRSGPRTSSWSSGPQVTRWASPPQVFTWRGVSPQSFGMFGFGPMHHDQRAGPFRNRGSGPGPHAGPWGMHGGGHGPHFGPFQGQGFEAHTSPFGVFRMGPGAFGTNRSDSDDRRLFALFQQWMKSRGNEVTNAPRAPTPPMMPPMMRGPGMRGDGSMPPGVGMGGREGLEAAKRQLEQMRKQLEAWEQALDDRESSKAADAADGDDLGAIEKVLEDVAKGLDGESKGRMRVVTPDGTTELDGSPEELRKQLEEWVKRLREVSKEDAERKAAK